MVRSRRSISKEDASSVLADSGISLSSPPTTKKPADPTAFNDSSSSDDDFDGDSISTAYSLNKNEDAENSSTSTESKTPKNRRRKRADVSKKPVVNKKQKLSKRQDDDDEAHTAKEFVEKPNRKRHVCDVCKKEFGGKTDLKRHVLIHSNERPHRCDECGKCYRQAVTLKHHIISAHKGQKEFFCELCPKAFPLKERLRLHMRVHSGDKPYACLLCDKRFARGGQLQQHKLIHHNKDSTLKRFHCEKCSMAFSTGANLRAHMERHEQGPDYKCEICNDLFINESLLSTHVSKIHQKSKQFDCETCKKTIKDDDLVSHMKKHANVKMHICEICDGLFTQKSQYNVHMRMHTGERPYQCRICWQTFAHSSVLKLHIRKHTGEKPYNCLLCKTDEVAFSQLAHLKTHMKKIHKQFKPYMCEGCNEFFKVKSELQTHMESCKSCDDSKKVSGEGSKTHAESLSNLRFLVALLLKKISTEQKLQQLGFEKRLIDNVLVTALKLANRKTHEDNKLEAIERMRLNISEFLNWIVPAPVMKDFQEQQQLTIDRILDKIVTMHTTKK